MMTDMTRTTIYLPGDMVDKIKALNREERFAKCSKTELIRILVGAGLETIEAGPKA